MDHMQLSYQAESRSAVYALLASFFITEPSVPLMRMLKNNLGAALADASVPVRLYEKGTSDEEFVEKLTVEYTRLFIGPGRHVSLYESVYRESGDTLWGKATGEVKRFIESLGLNFRSDWHGLPDHLAVELEFMQRLVQREKEAWQTHSVAAATRCLELENKFFQDHITQWVPVFCKETIEAAHMSFYKQVARMTREFIGQDHRYMQELISKQEKKVLMNN